MVRVKLRVGDTEIISSAAVEVVGAVGSVQEEQRVQGLYLIVLDRVRTAGLRGGKYVVSSYYRKFARTSHRTYPLYPPSK